MIKLVFDLLGKIKFIFLIVVFKGLVLQATAPDTVMRDVLPVNDWDDYGTYYSSPTVTALGKLCILEGLVKNGDYDSACAMLPEGFRPPRDLVFCQNGHAENTSMTVSSNGEVLYSGSSLPTQTWLPLSGLVFSTEDGTALTYPNANWTGNLTVATEGPLCVLQGTVTYIGTLPVPETSGWEKSEASMIARLPEGFRPPYRVIFNADHNKVLDRIDIFSDGYICITPFNTADVTVSLSGIMFSTEAGTTLTPAIGSQYGGDNLPFSYKQYGNICLVAGAISYDFDANPSEPILLGTVPSGSRPLKRDIFNANNHSRTNRVDVYTDGSIKYVAGERNDIETWMVLCGFPFATAQSTRLPGRRNYFYVRGDTGTGYSSSWALPVPGNSGVRFKARSMGEIGVHISTGLADENNQTYYAYFGLGGNTYSAIGKFATVGSFTGATTYSSPSALVTDGYPGDGQEWGDYWVKLDSATSTISFGKGVDIGASWDETTGTGQIGSFTDGSYLSSAQYVCLVGSNVEFCDIFATSLYGTRFFQNETYNYVFRDGDCAKGFVRFGNGFTVVPGTNHGSSVTFDTCISCSGGFDLRGTSTLKLTGDLTLDSATTLTSGGTIYGYNRALKLNGKLTLASGNVIHLGGNLIIDAQGHDIFINEYSQLMLDNGATITIKNATIHNKKNSAGWPSIALTTTLCRLTLSDVELALDSDFYINSGQVFIHNDVAVTGTSALVWRSIGPCTIEPNSTLYFDVGTTFSYAPPCTNKDLIRMMDQSSNLHLNGCSLLATHTGLRLTQGSVLFDNRVVVNSDSGRKLTSLTSAATKAYGTSIFTIDFTKDGKYLSVAGLSPSTFDGSANTNDLQIYKLNGTTLTGVTSQDYGYDIIVAKWSPDGHYLALGGNQPSAFGGSGNSNELQVYSFNGSSLTALTSQDFGTAEGSFILALAWSPDGHYLAVGGKLSVVFGGVANTDELQLYYFDGQKLTAVTSQAFGTEIRSLSWSPDGLYLAVGGHQPAFFDGAANSNELQIYKFNGLSLEGVTSQDYGTYIYSVEWSPDGKFLALGGNMPSKFGGVDNTNELQVYGFNGSTLSPISSKDYGTDIYMISWSPDGRYIAVGGSSPSMFDGEANSNELHVYSFDGSNLTGVLSQAYGDTIWAISWLPNQNGIAIGGDNATTSLVFYTCNYLNETATQAVTNGITFGNSSVGANADVNATLLSGARVEINGILNWDAAT